MPALLKKYQSLAREQSPFKLLSDMERMIKKERSKYSDFRENPNAANSHIKFWTRVPKADNVPINVGSLDEMYAEMRKAVNEMQGTNFVLGMLTDEGQYQVWRRPNQPCQGGEMRKYGITHDDSTRPLDPRPNDLYYPFPDGKPIAVGSRVGGLEKSYRHQIHALSPWRRAYGFEDNIELVRKPNGEINGLIALNADHVEPTMMVHLLRDARYWENDPGFYGDLSPQAVFLIRKYTAHGGGGRSITYDAGHNYQDHDDNISFLNINAIAKGGVEASVDLSGGTLGGRFDYNRPKIESAYRGETGKNMHINQVMGLMFAIDKTNKPVYVNKDTIKAARNDIEGFIKRYA